MGEMADDIADLSDLYEEPEKARCAFCGDKFFWHNFGTYMKPDWGLHTSSGKRHNCRIAKISDFPFVD